MIPDPPIFEPRILARVVTLVKAAQAETLLQILRTRIVEVSELDEAAIAGPDGLAHLHRLTSEAGLLGFGRLSTVCSILDDGPDHRSADQIAWARAELHSTLERSHEEIVRQLDGLSTGGHHGLAR